MHGEINMIDIGERAESGIPNLSHGWRGKGWMMPDITEQLDPERTILELAFKKSAINIKMKETIIAYLTDHAGAKKNRLKSE